MSAIGLSSHILCSVACVLLQASPPAGVQEVPKAQATPAAVARASFERLKRNEIPEYVSLFHPAALDEFHKFAVSVFAWKDPDKVIHQLRGLFAPYDSADAVAMASGADLMTAYLKNSIAQVPGFAEVMSTAKLQILGEIVENDNTVHVITRTVLPRPSPVTCIRKGDRWYVQLTPETMRMMLAVTQKERIRKENLSAQDVSALMKMGKIQVIGHVPDGDKKAHVLARVSMKFGEASFPMLGCYPVRQGEPAWDHLTDKDKSALTAALREKWTP